MTKLFLEIVNMSIAAGWVLLAVLLLRLFLKKSPKWITVALWGIVAFRLFCPFAVESAWSVIPSAQTVGLDSMADQTPTIDTGIPIINDTVNPMLGESFAPALGDRVNPLQIVLPILAAVWLIGILSLLLYTAFSYVRVARKVSTAVLLCDNVYQSENVTSPFVLGLIRPKIYLSFGMADHDMQHVIAHEQAHIRRVDHIWKPLGFCLLALHWFNPLVWLGYVLFCRDLELACDEKVIAALDRDARADYTQALLNSSVSKKTIAACPLAFGEIGIKQRIKNVLHYKKPTLWLIVLAIVIASVAAVCLLTDPKSGENMIIPDKQTVHTEYDDVYITFKSLDTNAGGYKVFNVTWHNKTDQEVIFGEAYAIQRYENGKWVSAREGESWANDIANLILPGGTANHSYTTQHYDISAVGTYRLLCWFYAPDGEEYYTWIEFVNEEVDLSVESGVSAIKVEHVSSDEFRLNLDYSFGTGGYTVRNVDVNEGEHIGDGVISYDGSLGKYRVLVTFGDDEPTEKLLHKLPVGQTVELDGVKVKRVCPSDHGFWLYIGSDRPISVTEASGKLNPLGGTIEIPIHMGE